MSPIDYSALQSGQLNVEVPADGDHVAHLERAALVSTNNGERLVTEWAGANENVQWTSWNRFDETGLTYTVELLDGLGVDRSAIADDEAFTDALDAVVDNIYEVRTSSQKGKQGDRWFTTTYVNGRATGVQEALEVDAPADTTGLPPAPGSVAGKVSDTRRAPAPDDEKIPF